MPALRKTGIDKRRWPRHARRIVCEVWIRGVRYSGIVKDVSSGGLFMQTRAKAAPGTVVTVVVPLAESRPEIRVTGRVARNDLMRAHLATQASGGLAIETVQVGALGRLIGDPRLTQSEPDPQAAEP